MGRIEQILSLIFNVDKKSLDKSLSDVEKKSVQSSQKISSSISSAFGALSSGLAALGIGKIFSSAISEANKFEKTLLGVSAAAKLAGQDVDTAQSNVLKLAEDGQVSLQDSAQIIKQLTAQGIDAQKALDFAQAGKRVAAFNGISATASESLKDFTAGLLKGSAELLENLDPSLQAVIKKLGGYAKVSQDAEAKQKLLNVVIEKGAKLQDDYNKFLDTGAAKAERFEAEQTRLLASLGSALQGAFSGVTSFLTDIIKGFREFLDGLTPAARQALILGGALTALVPIVSGAVGALKGLTGATSGFKAILAALNLSPTVLALTALVAVGTAAIVVFKSLNKSVSEQADETLKLDAQTKSLTNKYIKQIEAGKKLELSQNKRSKILIDLIKAEDELGIAVNTTSDAYQNLEARIQAVATAQRQRNVQALTDVANELTAVEAEIDRLNNFITQTQTNPTVLQQVPGIAQLQTAIAQSQLQNLSATRTNLSIQLRRLQDAINNQTQTQTQTPSPSPGGNSRRPPREQELKDNLFLLTQFEKQLNTNRKQFSDYINFLKQERRKGRINEDTFNELSILAERKRIKQLKELLEQRKKDLDSFFGNELQLRLKSIEKEKQKALEANLEEFRLERILASEKIKDKKKLDATILSLEKKFQQQRLDIDKEAELKKFKARLENAQKIGDKIGQALEGARSAFTATSGQEFFGGLGGAVGTVSPEIGGILQTVGAVQGVVDSILDTSEKQKQLEEQRQRQLEIQRDLIQSQVELSLELQNLTQERAKLIDKETELELKKNAILFQDDQKRAAADLKALERLKIKQADDAGLDVGNTEQIVKQINELSEKNLAGQSALNILGGYQEIPEGATLQNINDILSNNINILSNAAENAPSGAKSAISNLLGINKEIKSFYQGRTNVGSAGLSTEQLARVAFERATEGQLSNIQAVIESLNDETEFTLDRSSALLDTIKRIQDLEGQTIGGGQTGLDLREGRRESFIDVIRGGTTSRFGQFVQGVTATPRPTVSQGVGAIALATKEQGKSIQERQLDAAENAVEILEQMLTQLVQINEAVGGETSLSGEQIILQTLENIQNRLVG
jgi:hypothetical protein